MAKMAVVGAGLVGSLWARMLGNRGHEVVVYERRPDPRLGPLHGGRSINLALSDRGWKALEVAGVSDLVREIALPIRGRRMHAVDGTRTFQPYEPCKTYGDSSMVLWDGAEAPACLDAN